MPGKFGLCFKKVKVVKKDTRGVTEEDTQMSGADALRYLFVEKYDQMKNDFDSFDAEKKDGFKNALGSLADPFEMGSALVDLEINQTGDSDL